MQQHEDERRKLVGEWIHKADLDFDVAVCLAAQGDRFREAVAFHSQQAAEKYLKALLVRHQVEFPRTHDIERLLQMLRGVDAANADALLEAKWLGPFGVEIRYPGDFPETVPGDELRAMQLAQLVRETVMGLVGPYLAKR